MGAQYQDGLLLLPKTAHWDKEKFGKNISNDGDIWMVESAMERGFDIVRVLEDPRVQVRDPQIPEPRKVPLECRGVKNGGSFVTPTGDTWGCNNRVGGPIIG